MIGPDFQIVHLPVDEPTEQTFDAVKLLMAEARLVPSHDGTVDLSDIQEYLETDRQEDAEHYGLVLDDESIAAAAVVLHKQTTSNINETHTYIEALAVEEDCRRWGYGRELVNYAAEKGLNLGDTAIRLASLPDAEPFYDRLGFEREKDSESGWTIPIDKLL